MSVLTKHPTNRGDGEMATYTITEKLSAQSTREGSTVEARNLSDAKRKASKMQCFQGTVLEIADASGVLSIKKDGKWIAAVEHI